MYHHFLIHSSADGNLGCFHVLAIINSAVMNIGVHVSLSVLVSLVCMPSSGMAGSYGSSKKIYDISNEGSVNSFHKIQIPFFNIRKIIHYLQVCYQVEKYVLIIHKLIKTRHLFSSSDIL